MREKIENGHNVDIDQFLEDLKLVVRDGQELLRAQMGRLREQARFGAQKTGVYVREKPYQTVGIAFGVGLLAGVLAAGLLKGGGEEDYDEET